ncbi:hypothetical protein D2T30_03175 [Sinirhodobacter populi]|uniref:Uncharacterized protein n=1 Tax=Paenirhodobacter populi TaxID=2306993 RepID=A0A443JSJ4_9RHOB|nr:hypothetical protein D2T30_03175 [Sinirhodobacter populi]
MKALIEPPFAGEIVTRTTVPPEALDLRLNLVQGKGLADARGPAQQRQTGTGQNLVRHHTDH